MEVRSSGPDAVGPILLPLSWAALQPSPFLTHPAGPLQRTLAQRRVARCTGLPRQPRLDFEHPQHPAAIQAMALHGPLGHQAEC